MGFNIGEFVQSDKYKLVMGYVYGWGAAVVLAGALFKIQHWTGASVMLTAGMGTEIVIFFLSAFDPPHKEVEWHKVWPVLAHDNEEEGHEEEGEETVAEMPKKQSALETFDALLEQGKLGPELFENLGEGLSNLTNTASKLSDLSEASAVTNDYVEKVKGATNSMTSFADTYTSSVEELANTNSKVSQTGEALAQSYMRLTESFNNDADQTTEGNKTYAEQLSSMNKNLEALNAVYEMQINNSNEYLEASKSIYSGVNDMMEELSGSVSDAKKYKEQVAQLGNNLQALNTVYGNMLAAMNINNQ